MSERCSIELDPVFRGTMTRGTMKVVISGALTAAEKCSDLRVSLSCPQSQSSGPAILDGRTGTWRANLDTKCSCGTDLVAVVVDSPDLGCSVSSAGPIVCYVDWHRSSILNWLASLWTIDPRQFLAAGNFGACYKCMSISVALLALSLLVLIAGAIVKLAVVVIIGGLATLASGALVGLHAIFFVLKRTKQMVIGQPQQPHQIQHRRSCCGS